MLKFIENFTIYKLVNIEILARFLELIIKQKMMTSVAEQLRGCVLEPTWLALPTPCINISGLVSKTEKIKIPN